MENYSDILFRTAAYLAAPLIPLIMLSILFPRAWMSLKLSLRVRMEAHRAKAAGMTDEAIASIESALSRAAFAAWRIVSQSDAARAWTYMRLAGDPVLQRREHGWTLVLVVILVLADGAALGYVLRAVGAVDASPEMLSFFSAAAGVIGAGLLALGMDAAGRQLKWRLTSRDIRRRILMTGGTLPEDYVTLSQPQEVDQALSAAARQWGRAQRATALWPAVLCFLFVLFIAIAASLLRREELLQLRAAGATGLPSDVAFLTGIVMLGVFFVALQVAVGYLAYRSAWIGRESQRAYELLLKGSLSTEKEVARHNHEALAFAENLHQRFHQHLQRINLKQGIRPVRPVIFPSQVLAQMLSERVGMESLTTESPNTTGT